MQIHGYSTMGNGLPRSGPSTGSGRNGMETPFGRVTVSGKIGDVHVVQVTDIYSSKGSTCNFYAQAIGGSVAIACTLAPPDLAASPDVAGEGIWADAVAVVPGTITMFPPSVAMRITFTQAAIVYLIGA